MLLTALRLLYILAASGATAVFVNSLSTDRPDLVNAHPFLTWLTVTALMSAFVVADLVIRRKRIEDISAVYFGVLVGSLLSYLLLQALSPFVAETSWEGLVEIIVPLALVYVSVSFLLQTKGEFRFIIPFVEFSRELKGGRPLVLDDSALIDGRIVGLAEAGLADTLLVVPDFVINLVQSVADSPEKSRRARGRRGLDMLQKLRDLPGNHVRVEATGEELTGQAAEHRLLSLADEMGARLVTNDQNLARAASARGIGSVNLNVVANALKPRHLPGDRFNLKIQKRGEAPGQGVGYLDDGTMVVCEEAAPKQGYEVQVEVTSVLQNNSGRMIFSKLAV
ncbi:PIN/TRAM domain-containing protein [Alienimonas sp. DA493]|uniref:PIN/TRAM domain-containing protein n=1 Tax=Alienimonas sp. DA493 TaxID=3373605 RepID=UPI0037540185